MITDNQVRLVALLEKKYFVARNTSDQDMRETLLAGLTWDTSGWIDCALEWIEQGFELDEGIVIVLEQITKTKRLPQSTRHKAFKYSKRWLKSTNT